MANVYYEPKQFDLIPLGDIEFSDEAYQFDTRAFWKHEPTGKLLTARDSGCSCPLPFEDFRGVEELEDLDLAALEAEIKSELRDGYSSTSRAEALKLLRELEGLAKSG
jgi:hypothetical protein